ncbi:MAG: hypothetical protein K8I27_13850 [Planctomycetes bacterium]|nr:hypothetical protein [Planctomycetota bacterium]
MSTSDANVTRKQPDAAKREERLRLVLVGVFTAMFMGVLVVYFVLAIFDTPLKPDNFTNSYSTSPAGHSALVELLRENGREVKPRSGNLRAPEDNGPDTETLVMLEPGAEFVSEYREEFSNLFSSARQEHTSVVLVLPKRDYELAEPQPEDGAVVLWESVHPVEVVRGVLEDTGFDKWLTLDRLEEAQGVVWRDGTARVEVSAPVQVFRANSGWGDELEVLAETESGDAVVVRWRGDRWETSGGVILVSDPDFLSNRFISSAGAGEFGMKIFGETPKRGPILIDEDLHGFSADADLEYLAATPPGLWVTLSAMALLLVFAWRQATVLRPLSAEPQDRQARKYAIEGLARMMERTGEHDSAARRIMKRSRFVLGTGAAQVQGAGSTGVIQKGRTGKITRLYGGTSEERLIAIAAKVAHQKRTGETEHGEYE